MEIVDLNQEDSFPYPAIRDNMWKHVETLWKHVKTCEKLWKHVKTCEHMWKIVKTCENMWKHVKTCENMWKNVKTCENMWTIVKTCENMWKHVKNCENMWKHVKNMWNMWKIVKTCENMWKHVKTCEKLWKHVKTCEKLWKHVKTCENMWKHVKNCENMWKHVKTCENMWKIVKTCENMWKIVKTCENMWKQECSNTYQLHPVASSCIQFERLRSLSASCHSSTHCWHHHVTDVENNRPLAPSPPGPTRPHCAASWWHRKVMKSTIPRLESMWSIVSSFYMPLCWETQTPGIVGRLFTFFWDILYELYAYYMNIYIYMNYMFLFLLSFGVDRAIPVLKAGSVADSRCWTRSKVQSPGSGVQPYKANEAKDLWVTCESVSNPSPALATLL